MRVRPTLTKLHQKSPLITPGAVLFVLIFGLIGLHLLFNSHAATPTTPTIAVCGERQASDVEEYTGPTLATSPLDTRVVDGTSTNLYIGDFHLVPGSPNRWFIRTGLYTFVVYDASTDALITSFTIPNLGFASNEGLNFGVDPSGNYVYIGGATTMDKISTAGAIIWSKTTAANLDYGSYSYGTGSVFMVAAVGRGLGGSYVWDANGNPQPNNVVIGSTIHTNPASGDILSTDGSSVYIFSPDGLTRKFSIGTNLPPGGPGPFRFYVAEDVEELPDSRIMVNTGHGLLYFASDGTYLGKVNVDPFANPKGAIDSPANSQDLISNGIYYYVSGQPFGTPQHLAQVPLTSLESSLAYPQGAPFHLGIGAGPFTNVPDNYFPAGTTPQVYLRFYQWWQTVASNFSGQYTIRSIEQIKGGQAGTGVSYSVPSSISSYANGYADIPVNLPSTQPGYYEMNVTLQKNGVTVGADCLDYTIGSPASPFNNSSPNLSAGTDTAGIELAHAFGQKLFRSSYGIANCYPGVTTPTVSTTVACPSNLVNDVNAAAALANQYGMTYEIQIGAGGSWLTGGTAVFQSLVQQMVTALPPVTNWECWNEPDTNTFSSGSDYVTRALIPCYQGMKAANVNDKMIGGSFSSMTPTSSWWTQFLSSGLPYVDVVALHTYTGHNRSIEEQGYIIPSIYSNNGETGIIQQFQQAFKNAGFNGPVWDTEQGYWVDGPYNSYTQGDRLIRKQILERSIGITNFSNFQNSADYLIGCCTYSLIHNGALTTGGTASTVYGAQLFGRQFVTWLPTGVPHSYAAEFGPSASDSGSVVAVWTDDMTVGLHPTLSGGGAITTVDEFGLPGSVAFGTNLTATGSVQYLAVPAGQTITVAPAETFGANLALASAGSSAAASSSYACSGYSLTPNRAIDGLLDTQGLGNICDGSGMSIWVSSVSDTNPTLTITLPSAKAIDRVYVSSQGLGSVEVGLRDYTVSFDTGSGSFGNPITVTNQFLARNNLIQLPSTLTVTRIQIANMDINYSGYGDGLPPTFWNSGFPGQPTVYEVEAYAPGSITQTPPPSAPSNLTAQASSPTNVNLSWTASSDTGGPGIGGYYILRNGSNIAKVGTQTSYSDATVSPSTVYNYTVEAYDVQGSTSGPSNTATVTTPAAPDTTSPSIPTNVSAVATAYNSITINWTASTDNVGVAGYYVLRSISGGAFQTVAHVSGTGYTDTSVSANTAYSYEVEAYDAAGNVSVPSATATVTTPTQTDTTPPSQPAGLTASAVSSSQINLSWTASTDNVGVTGYLIYRNNSQIANITTNLSTPSFGDTGLAANTSYSYYVVAYDAASNKSAASATVSATTNASITTGIITGFVYNNKHVGIAGAAVWLTVNGATQTYTTTSNGSYSIPGLLAGNYTLFASASGYSTRSVSATVSAGTTTVVNITLQKGHK